MAPNPCTATLIPATDSPLCAAAAIAAWATP